MAQILLLETDHQLAKNMRLFFSQSGHRLVHFASPQSAVTSADSHQPDLIILDLFLAARSGIEFLYELRSYPEWQSIPVIVTGRLNPAELSAFANAFRELNIAAYFHKSSSFGELLTIVDKILQPVVV